MLLDNPLSRYGLDLNYKAALLLLIAIVAVWLLRNRSSALRHQIWTMVFAGLVCLPWLSLIVPAVAVPLLPQFQDRAAAISATATNNADRMANQEIFPNPQLSEDLLPNTEPLGVTPNSQTSKSLVGDRHESIESHAAIPADTASAISISSRLGVGFVGLWALGCLISLMPLLVGFFRNPRLLRKAEPLRFTETNAKLRDVIAQAGLRRSVRLMITRDDIIPMTWGLFRPVILIPSEFENWDRKRQRVVLLHELAHIRRCDWAVQLTARLVCGLFWFNPLAWHGLRRLRIVCEQACDDFVVGAGQPVVDYAAELVNLAEAYRMPRLTQAIGMARNSQFSQRITSMLDGNRSHAPLGRREAWSSILLAGLLTAAVLILQPVTQTSLAEETKSEEKQDQLKRLRVDAMGDPLPEAALIRMGALRFQHPDYVVELALSPDETRVVTIGEELVTWDAQTGKELWRSNTRDLKIFLSAAAYGGRLIVFAPGGQTMYTPGQPNEVLAWDVESGEHEVIKIKPGIDQPANSIGPTRSVDVSPDGQWLAVGNNAQLVICDLAGETQHVIANNPQQPIDEFGPDRLCSDGEFSYGRFSPNGKLFVLVNSESPKEIRVHEAQSGKELRRIPLTDRLVRLAFSPDSTQIAATERDSAVRKYDVATAERLWEYQIELKNNAESYTCGIAYSPDAKTIAVCAPIGSDYDIHLLRAESGQRFGKPLVHLWKPWAVAFTADSQTLFSSGWDGAIRRWDVATQRQIDLPGAVHSVGAVAVSPNGQLAAHSDEGGAVHVLNVADGKELRQLKVPGGKNNELAFSPDSRLLAGGGKMGEQVHITVWDVADGKIAHHWNWPKGRDTHSDFNDLCFSPNGKMLAGAVHRQSTGYVLDLETGQELTKIPHREIHGLSFSPNNATLATAGWDKVLAFWDPRTGEKLREVNMGDLNAPKLDGDVGMHAVRYSPQNNLIATLHCDSFVRLWDAENLQLIAKIYNGRGFSQGGSGFSPDGLWYATGDAGGQVRLWDSLTGQLVWDRGKQQDRTKARGFGGLGRTLASGDEGICYLWDLRPTDVPLQKPTDELWSDLAGEDGPAAYRGIWALSERPEAAVKLLQQKLTAVTKVVDTSRIGLDETKEERERRKRLTQLMLTKNQQAASLATIQRSASLLAQIGTPEAIALLEQLSTSNNESVSQSAKHALGMLQQLESR